MTAYFNITLFKQNLLRFWPLAAVAFLAALIAFVVPEAASPRVGYFHIHDVSGSLITSPQIKDIMSGLAVFCTMVVFPLSIFTAIAVFGYLHNPKAAGFVSSLPISRTGLYITNWISGLAIMLVPILLAGALYGIQLIGQPVPSGDFIRWIGALVASHLVFFSIAVFCTFLTGNPIMQTFIYAAFNFICMVLYAVGTLLASMFVFGFGAAVNSPVVDFMTWLTPPVAIVRMIELMSPYRVLYFDFGNDINTLNAFIPWLLYLLFAALMAFFGWLLYRRRHIEAAGDILVHRPVKSVFKYLVGLFSGVLLALILTLFTIGIQTNNVSTLTFWFTLFTIVFGALGCLFAEMLIKKRLRVLKTAYKGIIVLVLSITAAILFLRLDGTGYERRVPDQTDVVSVSVTPSHMYYTSIHRLGRGFVNQHGRHWHLTWSYTQEQQRRGLPIFTEEVLHEIKLRTPVYFESPEAIAAAIKLHQTIADHGWYDQESFANSWAYQTFTITYTLKNGSILTRVYVLPMEQPDDNNLIELLLDLYNQPEAVAKRNRFVGLPDSSALAAILTPVFDNDTWFVHAHYESRLYFRESAIITDNLDIILEAMREDSANGTLGRLRHDDLSWRDNSRDGIATIGVIDLLVSSLAAGVPIAFEEDYWVYDDDSNVSRGLRGLVLSIIITENHVNTLQALEELGLLPN